MKSTIAALVLATSLAGCASTGGSSARKPPVIDKPLRHMLTEVTVGPELAGNVSPQLFETTLCSKIFEFNQKQVSCPDELRALLQTHRERAALGGNEPTDFEALMSTQNFQRRVSLSAAKAGAGVVLTVLVQDSKNTAIGRFQVNLASDGADVMDKAHDAAIQILSIPQ